MMIIRFCRPCNDNDDNPKKREHMQLVAFYLENRDMIERLVDSLTEEERMLWFRS